MQKLAGFDWSTVTRYEIAEHLSSLSLELVGKRLPIEAVYKKIGNRLKEKYPISTCKHRRINQEKQRIYIGGYYLIQQDKTQRRSIQIVFQFDRDEKQIKFNKTRFASTMILIADTIMHEIIHMRQYRRRNFNTLPDDKLYVAKRLHGSLQEYYGSKDELDAYSFNIACELIDRFKTPEAAGKYLNSNPKVRNQQLRSLKKYMEVFKQNHNHPVIKKLKKNVIKYLPHAVIGKPFNRANELKSN